MENLVSKEKTKMLTYFINQEKAWKMMPFSVSRRLIGIGSYLESSNQNYEMGQMEADTVNL